MSALSTPLILTKIQPPAGLARSVNRSVLLDQLQAESTRPLILICAPAGYGKSTLLQNRATMLHSTGIPVAWYALDEDDNQTNSFAGYLIASLQAALNNELDFSSLQQEIRTRTEINLIEILRNVINELLAYGKACVLLLDDYHHIHTPDIHHAMMFLIDHLPANVQVIIGSRADPPLPLARWRAQSKLFEFRLHQMRFSLDETSTYLNDIMHMALSPAWIATLERRTEGWITGLQLAALSISNRPDREAALSAFTGTQRYLADYLLEEVVEHQSPQIRKFLSATSLLERFCPALCDALLDRELNSMDIIHQLQQNNLFLIPLDEEGTWFRYHHLFRDFLQSHLLQQQSEQIDEIHRLAANWLSGHGFLHEAAGHIFRIDGWHEAAAFVSQYSFELIIHSEISTLHNWCARFPDEVMQQYPVLYALQCWPMVINYQREQRSQIELRLQRAEQCGAALADAQERDGIFEHAAVIRAFLSMAPDQSVNADEQYRQAKAMLHDSPIADPGQFSALLVMGYAKMANHQVTDAIDGLRRARDAASNGQLYFGILESTFHLTRMLAEQGDLKRAADGCQETMHEILAVLPDARDRLPAYGSIEILSGSLALEQNQLEAAEQSLQHGLGLIGTAMNPYYFLIACTTLARLYAMQHRPEDMKTSLRILEERWPDIRFCTKGLQLMYSITTPEEKTARQVEVEGWCKSMEESITGFSPPGMGPLGAAEAFYLAQYAWFYLQCFYGKQNTALPYLSKALEINQASGAVQRSIELLLLLALAYRINQDSTGEKEVLQRALSLAVKHGYQRIFYRAPAISSLLCQAQVDPPYKNLLNKVREMLECSAHTPSLLARTPDFAETPIEALSEREIELLCLIAEGATNQEIAEQLYITVGTVKSHINHILGKLNAHNRTEAVATARRIGYL